MPAASLVDSTLEDDDVRAVVVAAYNSPIEAEMALHCELEYSGERVLCMEFFDGCKPSDPEAKELTEEDRTQILDWGAAAIIRMLYKDGFFHADLHPGNLIILPGPRCGFIDLGMVGRFDEQLRRTLLYYYYCLIMGDADNAARYLASLAEVGPRGDPRGFRRVRHVRRWRSAGGSFSDQTSHNGCATIPRTGLCRR